MSEVYTGSNPGPIVGTFTIPTDGDDVNAASVNTAFQPLMDNDAYAKRVFPDLLLGGDYTALGTAQLTFSNPFVFKGSSAGVVICGTGALDIGHATLGGGTLAILANGDLEVTGQANFNSGNFAHVKSGAAWYFDSGSLTTYSGNMLVSGANAWRANRKTTQSTGNVAFVAQAWDTVWCYNATGSNHTIALTDPNVAVSGAPLPEGIRCTFCIPTGSGVQTPNASTVTIQDHTVNPLGVLTSGGLTSITVETVLVSGTIVWDTAS